MNNPRLAGIVARSHLNARGGPLSQWRSFRVSTRQSNDSEAIRPNFAAKPTIDIKHIRENASLYKNNCLERNYKNQSEYPDRINELFAEFQTLQKDVRAHRVNANLLRGLIKNPNDISYKDDLIEAGYTNLAKSAILESLRDLKSVIGETEEKEKQLRSEINRLAISLPNLTSDASPRSDEPRVLEYLNDHPEPEPSASDRVWRSHVHVGTELNLLDFSAAATTSGWGWYFLLNDGALLEQALIQYAVSTAMKQGWQFASPPSIVYSHIAAACGFQPRDQNNEQQIYTLSRSEADKERSNFELCLTGTAEIPLAGMYANTDFEEAELPKKMVAVSRSYRAEAGARGVNSKGLYRVHEFTKVEMFAWTPPSLERATELFNEIVAMQKLMLTELGLHCRVLEMPASDLGASAYRKQDIEAFFPSRRPKDDGFGEVTSTSICTDYQSRRLAARLRVARNNKVEYLFPYTVNGTAMAIPRVLAAILENGWDEERKIVRIPECLRPWMGDRKEIQ